jgi:hypothetical protein
MPQLKPAAEQNVFIIYNTIFGDVEEHGKVLLLRFRENNSLKMKESSKSEPSKGWIAAVKDHYASMRRFDCEFRWQRRYLGSNRDKQLSGRIVFARGSFLQLASSQPQETTIDLRTSESQGGKNLPSDLLGSATPDFGSAVVFVSTLLLGLSDFFEERKIVAQRREGSNELIESATDRRRYRYLIDEELLIEEIEEQFSISSGEVVERTVFSNFDVAKPLGY